MKSIAIIFCVLGLACRADQAPQSVYDSMLRAQAAWADVCPPAVKTENIHIVWVTDSTLGDRYGAATLGGNTIWINASKMVDPLTQDATLLHEVGHTLGLIHSPDSTAVMFATFQAKDYLSPPDIDAVQSLYDFAPLPLNIAFRKVGKTVRLSVSSDKLVYWDFGDGILESGSTTAKHRYPAKGIYKIVVRAGCCRGELSVEIGNQHKRH